MAQFFLKNARLISKLPIPKKRSNVAYYPKGTIFICKGIYADSLDKYNSSDKNWQVGVDYGFRLTVEGGGGEINVPSSMLYVLFEPIDAQENIISLDGVEEQIESAPTPDVTEEAPIFKVRGKIIDNSIPDNFFVGLSNFRNLPPGNFMSAYFVFPNEEDEVRYCIITGTLVVDGNASPAIAIGKWDKDCSSYISLQGEYAPIYLQVNEKNGSAKDHSKIVHNNINEMVRKLFKNPSTVDDVLRGYKELIKEFISKRGYKQ